MYLAAPPDSGAPGTPDDDLQNWSSLIGIITAISGNVIIALALNVQRYAHIRLHHQRALVRERAKQAMKNAAGRQQETYGGYGSADSTNGLVRDARRNGGHASIDALDPEETEPLTGSFRSDDSRWAEDDESQPEVTSTYLKDPYWWLGQVLITVGEMGNFLAYGFAPASIVSPLGVVALVSNCIIAPIFFKEVFRRRDFIGVVIAVTGAVTVVLSAKGEETKLGPHEVWDAITTIEFEIYMGFSVALIVLLMWLSPRYGNRTILIDLGLVGLFGGYTALSTKGVSSMLSSTLLGAFTTPVTYALLFVLLSTAVMQVRYVNKALQRFDSTQVIPIQFVLFTLSVIIGSAILYRDFERTTSEQAVKFIGGCLFTFFGVFLITSGRPRHDEEEDTLSDTEGIEETINLSNQGLAAPQTPRRSSRRASDSARSQRSSRVSFKDTMNRPLAVIAGTGIPTLRLPNPPNPKALFTEDGNEGSPLLGGHARESTSAIRDQHHQHPGMGSHAISSDSITSVAVSDSDPPHPVSATPTNQLNIPAFNNNNGTTSQQERPSTPRAPLSSSRPHSHHFGGPMISPSPFSSTVSAVVTDKLLAHIDSPTKRRTATRRNSRPGLRNSLFVPQDEVSGEDDEYEGDHLRATEGIFGDDNDDDDGHHHLQQHASAEGKHTSGLRGRARSLSHTLGELFGVKRSSHVVSAARRDSASSEDSGGNMAASGRRSVVRASDPGFHGEGR
ncbi:magnesium transporter NIPA-domain-containing protein [Podospora appendiculata]|uniref:Magnesium transporter NIPA-domain-containing protein n=1 Tax=Podospora appendiculata TaxID=314037 RepID=A0AAE1CF65_9PEZI|nr:magnesium transporter NIPA-domain-containing protein [Podospora appendiculata]